MVLMIKPRMISWLEHAVCGREGTCCMWERRNMLYVGDKEFVMNFVVRMPKKKYRLDKLGRVTPNGAV